MGINIKEHECYNNNTDGCTFDLINGSCLATLGIVGFILSSALIWCLIFDVIKLPGSKKIFMINVSVNDALLGIVGTCRGLGIISRRFMGVRDDGTINGFCSFYTIFASVIWHAIIFTLFPLTIDRFVAVVFSRKYKRWITFRVSWAMVILSWIPTITIHLLYDSINFALGTNKIEYVAAYSRCVFTDQSSMSIRPVMLLLVPLCIIVLLYGIMVTFIINNKIPVGRLLKTTSAILFTGAITVIPEVMIGTNLEMSYEVAQIATVTLYHANCIYNPIIYFIANPKVTPQLKEQASLRHQQIRRTLTRTSTSLNKSLHEALSNAE